MFKKILIGTLAAIIVVAVGTTVYTGLAAPVSSVQPSGVGTDSPSANLQLADWQNDTLQALAPSQPAASLSSQETDSLLYMYEEEKLARDVYTALYTQWGQPTFQNIAASEQMHMDAIKTLLDRHGLTTPVSGPGTFTDASLQKLYNDLTVSGSQSLTEALKVGASIEELDILDLQTRLTQTTNAEIQQVYNNLMSGSYNHLRNFVTVLTRQTGGTYQPQYLSPDLYQSIMSGTNGSGQGAMQGASQQTGTSHGNRGNGYRGGRP